MSEKLTETVTKTFEKVTDTVLEPIKHRLSSSLIGSFAISWIVLNWKIILFLILSSQTIECKFGYIDRVIFNESSLLFYTNMVLLPLGIAALYALGLSWIESGIEWANLRPSVYKMNRQSKLTKLSVRNQIKEQAGYVRLAAAKSDYKEVKDAREKIKDLNVEIVNLKSDHEKALKADKATNDLAIAEIVKQKNEQISSLQGTNRDQEKTITESIARQEEWIKQRNDEEQKHLEKVKELNDSYSKTVDEMLETISDQRKIIRENDKEIAEKKSSISDNASKHDIELESLKNEYESSVKELEKELRHVSLGNGKLSDEIKILEATLVEKNHTISDQMSLVNDWVESYNLLSILSQELVGTVISYAKFESYKPIKEIHSKLQDQPRHPDFVKGFTDTLSYVSVVEKMHYHINLRHDHRNNPGVDEFIINVTRLMGGYSLIKINETNSRFEIRSEIYHDIEVLRTTLLTFQYIIDVEIKANLITG